MLDVLLALLVGELLGPVLERLGLPVLVALVGGLEGRVFTNRSIGVGVDLLNIFGANAVGEVARELLLEASRSD